MDDSFFIVGFVVWIMFCGLLFFIHYSIIATLINKYGQYKSFVYIYSFLAGMIFIGGSVLIFSATNKLDEIISRK